MALVVANPFGELKGTLGGIVFTKNKAGQVARVYGKPCTSQSQAVYQTRQQFQQVSKSWKNLVAPLPANWAMFARSVYSPIKRTNRGQYSGYQSFMACRNAVANSNKWITPVSITTDVSGAPIGMTQIAFPESQAAEEASIQPNLFDTNLPAKPITIDNIVCPANGAVQLRLRWIPNGMTGLGGTMFIDFNHFQMSIVCYISDVISCPTNIPKHQFKQIICSTGKMLITTPNLNLSHYADFTFSSNPLISNSKQFPSVGHYVLFSVCNVSPLGTQSLIGSRITVIS